MYNVLTLKGSPLVADTSEGVVQRLVARLGAWSANETVDRKGLMALADTYEATQPSYAADLRAAAALQSGA